MNILDSLKKYLVENGSVGICRLGRFELVYREAEVHPILQEFTPPGKYLSFTADESEEGADFVRYVADSSKMEIAEAAEQTAQWVLEVRKALEAGNKYELGKMGRFVMGNVRMEFVPGLDPELSPDSFGFSSFTLRNDGSEKTEEKNIVNEDVACEKAADDNVEKESVTNGSSEKENAEKENVGNEEDTGNEDTVKDESRPKRHVGRTIFYILLILLLLCVIAMGVFALLRPVEFVEKKDRCVSSIASFFHCSADTVKIEPEDTVVSESGWEMQEAETEPVDTLEPETDTIAPVVPADANCYVIIGGFGNSANADNLVRSLKGKYPNVCNLGLNQKGTLTMVGIGPYTRAEAETRVQELNSAYKDCWIFEK